MAVLDAIAAWLNVDAVLLGYVLGLLSIVVVAIFVSVLTESSIAIIFSIFATWVVIALPGIEMVPTWTLSIAFLLLLLAFAFPTFQEKGSDAR